ncbi:hypothetical protein [Geomesophilobacter sediminis]|uniref:Uncharacterized protein n=1 Tax=Geomesophilobacter sediminis TaxID=2798584 RepID=A0A8J7M1A8_9BACT|nr:hypothetical protein [Geomesophilobacter sediminis]MBJ6726799.1 hypothetical protein [Geomesophilobacter sediminis]
MKPDCLESITEIGVQMEGESIIVENDTAEDDEVLQEEYDVPDYNNYMPFDVDLYSEDERVKGVVQHLCSEMGHALDLAVLNMTVLLLNLYKCWLVSPRKWVAYSRRPAGYVESFQYNVNRIAYRPMKKISDYLIVQDYVSYKRGFHDERVKVAKRSRIKAEQKLVDLFGKFGFSKELLNGLRRGDVIILKDSEKKKVKFTDNSYNDACRKRNLVLAYNGLLRSTYLDLDLDGYVSTKCLHVDMSRKAVCRIFSNGSFTQGGRFYGGFWMGIPEDLRTRIIINNQEVMEYDFKGMHLKMLYAKEGRPYGVEDPYRVPGYEQTKKIRNIFKTLTLILLNSKPGTNIKAAFMKDFKKKPQKYPDEKDLPNIDKAAKAMMEFHAPISKYFFSGIGIKLQYEDSQIAERVIGIMTRQQIPVLSIHDSFVFPRQHEDQVSTIMRDAFRSQSNMDINDIVVFKYSERNTYNEEQGSYEYNIGSIADEHLKQRMLYFKETNKIPDYLYQIDLHAVDCKCNVECRKIIDQEAV